MLLSSSLAQFQSTVEDLVCNIIQSSSLNARSIVDLGKDEQNFSTNLESALSSAMVCQWYDGFVRRKLVDILGRDSSPSLFCWLIGRITQKRTDLRKEFLVLIELYLLVHRLDGVISVMSAHRRSGNEASHLLADNHLIQLIVSLPDRVAWCGAVESSSPTHMVSFFRRLTEDITTALIGVAHHDEGSIKTSIAFIARLTGKMVVLGKAGDLAEQFSVLLTVHPEDSRVHQTLHSLLPHLPVGSLDGFLENLIRCLTSPAGLTSLLGDFLQDTKYSYLLSVKLLLVKFYDEIIVPYNVLNCLASMNARDLLNEVTLKLLTVWSDRCLVRHISHSQYLYITKVLCLVVPLISADQRRIISGEAVRLVMAGIPAHLESSDNQITRIGMFMGELLTDSFIMSMGTKLKFEYEDSEDIKLLRRLVADPESVFREELSRKELRRVAPHPTLVLERNRAPVKSAARPSPASIPEGTSLRGVLPSGEEVDSDDDLPLYPLDDDNDDINLDSANGVRPPSYLRDCIAGLLSNDDARRSDACLSVCAKLIRREPAELTDVSLELTGVLLHLEDRTNSGTFQMHRFSALTAVTVTRPLQVSVYLTEQFYAENYSISQRILILEVLRAASEELSRVLAEPPGSQRSHLPVSHQQKSSSHDRVPEWKLAIEKRLEAKTRRFVKKRSCPAPEAPSRFSDVAGFFFFGLLRNFDRKLRTLDLLDSDHAVLGKFLHTLGVITHAARGCSTHLRMVSELLEFLWIFQEHKESFVRVSLLLCLDLCLISCPAEWLVQNKLSELRNYKSFLEEILMRDSNERVQELAEISLNTFQLKINEGTHIGTDS